MNSPRLSGALFLGGAFALASSSHAQPAPTQQQATPEKPAIVPAQIQVQNVPSNLMAYWLDPTHQPTPPIIQFSLANGVNLAMGGEVFQNEQLKNPYLSIRDTTDAPTAPVERPLKLRPGNGYGPLNLKLPAGIETVVSIDPKNEILVRGTAAGIEQLRALVAQLDVPLSEVEVEVQFCQLARADLGALSPSFVTEKTGENPVIVAGMGENPVVPPNQTNQFQIGFIRNNFTAKINDLIAQNKLKVITAPRVTAISGLTAKIQSQERRAFTYAALSEDISDETKASGILPEGIAFSTSETGIVCTPLVYKDLIQLDLKASLAPRALHLMTTVKDGQTLAVEFPAENANSETATVLFVTARIIRRAGD